MQVLIDQLAALDRHHLVDSVGELIAAVFDVNGGGSMRLIAAVDVSDTRHVGE